MKVTIKRIVCTLCKCEIGGEYYDVGTVPICRHCMEKMRRRIAK